MRYFVVYLLLAVMLALLVAQDGHPAGFVYLASTCLIALLAAVTVYNPLSSDLLEPIKIAGGFYGLSFGLGPLLLGPIGYFDIWYLGNHREQMLEDAAVLCLIGFIVMLGGYFMAPPRCWLPSHNVKSAPPVLGNGLLLGGVVVGLVGLASYSTLVIQAGGIGHFLSYSGGRADIFRSAYGGFYWGSFFLISGLAVVSAALVDRRPIIVLVLGLAVGLLFALFQGRAAALMGMLVVVLIFHYGYRRLSLRVVFVAAVALLTMASLLGAYRTLDKDASGTEGFAERFFSEIGENLASTYGTDIERLDMVAVSERYRDMGGQELGGSSLLFWIGPINRMLFRGELELFDIGTFLNGEINPHLRGARTAAQPSLPGELNMNFGPLGVWFGLFLYGLLLKTVGRLVNSEKISRAKLALFAYPAMMLSMVVIAGTHVLFQVLVVSCGVLFATLFGCRSASSRVVGAEQMREPPSPHDAEMNACQKHTPMHKGKIGLL